MTPDENVVEIVIVEPEDVDEIRRLAVEHGVEIQEPPVQPMAFPIIGVAMLLIGAAGAVATVVHLLDRQKGGQVIDLRATEPRKMFYRTTELQYGLVVIITTDGKLTVEVKEPKGMFGQVVDALKDIVLGMGKAGVEAIAAASREKVGDKAQVTVEASPAP